MTVDHAHPPQLRLPGQAAAPDGPIDMYAMYLVHHGFRRDLAAFVEAARRTPLRDARRWRRVAERWELFANVLHDHHTSEDAHIWPYVRARAADREQAVLDAMEREHGAIDPVLVRCRDGLRRMVADPTPDTREALHEDLLAAQELLDHHLSHEEEAAIPVIQRRVTAEEWARLEKEELREGVRLRDVLPVVPWSLHGVPEEGRARVFAAPGGAVLRFLWLLTRGGFARRERRAFGAAG
jgi:hemerythrin-like domain-containing protein